MKNLSLLRTPFLLGALIPILAGCTKPAPVNSGAKAALTVQLVSPHEARWPQEVTTSGLVAPWQESIIGAEVNLLKLDQVLVDVGDYVHKGQVIARFNQDFTRADLAQAQATVSVAEANLSLAQDQADRARRLDGTGTVSHEALVQYEASEKSSEAQLALAKAQLSAAELRLDRTEVRAPDDGLISSRTATVGSVFGSGAELFRIIRQNRLEWRAEVSTDELSSVAAGQDVVVQPAGYPPEHGRVREIAPTVDTSNGSGIVYVDLPNPGPLKAGVYGVGRINITESPALFVPESVLVYRDGYTYVMKIDPDLRVEQLKITTGRRNGTNVEILAGVVATDKLVLSGGSFLNQGDTVLLAPAGALAGENSAKQEAGS